MKFRILAACLALLYAAPVGAVTLTFDDVPAFSDPIVETIVEKGVTITSSPASMLAWDVEPGGIHLDDCCTPFARWVEFATGGIFGVVSMDVLGLEQQSFVQILDDALLRVPYENLRAEGWLGGSLVASELFATGLDTNHATFTFGDDFAAIDLLRITVIDPTGQTYLGLPIECADRPCGHVELQALTLAPVPLPAGVVLVGSGLAALALFRRRSVG